MFKNLLNIRLLSRSCRNMSMKTFGTSTDMDSTSYKNDKLIYPAATRNQEPILKVLKQQLIFSKEDRPLLLEISSGSGQHTAYFAPHFPNVTFQPSEYDDGLLNSIAIYAKECPTKNIKEPLFIDICKNLNTYGFKENSVDVLYNANMIHISPYDCTINLFKNAGKYLKLNGTMITYGPYSHNGVITPESNINFNLSLKSRDGRWGLRDINVLTDLAETNGLSLKEIIDMPANNKCLIWKKIKQL